MNDTADFRMTTGADIGVRNTLESKAENMIRRPSEAEVAQL